jgi:Cu-Zn family superoxide dismutase
MLTLMSCMFFYGCGTNDSGNKESMDEEADMVADTDTEDLVAESEPMAMASISPASGSNVTGTVTFTQTADSTVTMQIDIQGISPGQHAIHLHETGDCSAPDATSAGGHWNPTGEDHGKRSETDQFHAGDIINLDVPSDSTYSNTIEVNGWTIGSNAMSDIVGRAVVIHADEDDFTSQPSGAAGSRIACGVIERQEM